MARVLKEIPQQSTLLLYLIAFWVPSFSPRLMVLSVGQPTSMAANIVLRRLRRPQSRRTPSPRTQPLEL